MITLAAIFGFFGKFGSSIISVFTSEAFGKFLSWFKRNWREVAIFGLGVALIIMLLNCCSGGSRFGGGSNGVDTLGVKTDTVWEYADTNAIFTLLWEDSLAKYTIPLHDSIRELKREQRPSPPVFHPDGDCSDSVRVLLVHKQLLNDAIAECDSLLDNQLAVRGYSDTMRTDSIEVSVAFEVQGRLYRKPKVNYRYLAPYPVITKTITIQEPQRETRPEIYLGGGIGPRLTWNGNSFDAITGSAEVGFETRKHFSIGLAGDFTHKDYAVRLVFRKGIPIGKQ